MIEIKLQRQFTEIGEKDWNDLLQKSDTNVPFLRYGYLKRWWEHKGGGEWADGELKILSAHDDGKLVGIAPLFKTTHEGEQKLLFLGSIEISDYLDFIYDPAYGQEFFGRILDFLSSENFEGASDLLLYDIPETAKTREMLEEECRKRGWKFTSNQVYHAPAIQLENDWDTYLAGIDKKQRHEIRRKLRRAEESPDDIQWYLANDADHLDNEISDLLNLMTMDDEKKMFLKDEMRAQMSSIIHWAFDEGILALSFLTIGGEKAASYLCFDYQDCIWVYNSGFDPRFRENSPGWVLLGYLIQNAINSGKHTFDFMRGSEDYKYRFGAADRFVLKIEIKT